MITAQELVDRCKQQQIERDKKECERLVRAKANLVNLADSIELKDLSDLKGLLFDIGKKRKERAKKAEDDVLKKADSVRKAKEYWLKTFDDYLAKMGLDELPFTFNVRGNGLNEDDSRAALFELSGEVSAFGWRLTVPKSGPCFGLNFLNA